MNTIYTSPRTGNSHQCPSVVTTNQKPTWGGGDKPGARRPRWRDGDRTSQENRRPRSRKLSLRPSPYQSSSSSDAKGGCKRHNHKCYGREGEGGSRAGGGGRRKCTAEEDGDRGGGSRGSNNDGYSPMGGWGWGREPGWGEGGGSQEFPIIPFSATTTFFIIAFLLPKWLRASGSGSGSGQDLQNLPRPRITLYDGNIVSSVNPGPVILNSARWCGSTSSCFFGSTRIQDEPRLPSGCNFSD